MLDTLNKAKVNEAIMDGKENQMVNSSVRKLALSGWLKNKHAFAYDSPLRLQKFLFFYEGFSKADEEPAEFAGLKGYKRGPVFSPVWGDYTKDREEFDEYADDTIKNQADLINNERAEKTAFLCSILSEDELSDITHELNIWKAKEQRIRSGEQQVPLDEKDISKNDIAILKTLENMYPIELINSVKIIRVNETFFVIPKKDIPLLKESHMDTLSVLSRNEELHNPVFVSIDEDGGLTID